MKIYRNIMLPVVLYGCATWSHTLRAGHRLRALENRVLRRIFGPKRGEVTEEWRKLHNEELKDLYFSPEFCRVVKSRRMRWAGFVTRMGERRGVYRVLMGEPEGKRLVVRPRPRWGIILVWIFRKCDVRERTESMWLRIGTGGRHL